MDYYFVILTTQITTGGGPEDAARAVERSLVGYTNVRAAKATPVARDGNETKYKVDISVPVADAETPIEAQGKVLGQVDGVLAVDEVRTHKVSAMELAGTSGLEIEQAIRRPRISEGL